MRRRSDDTGGVTHPALTYASYLKIDELLSLQQPRSDGPEHDEMLFIVIHQVYELWFKQVLWELDHAVELLDADDQPMCGHTLNRVRSILKVMVAQMDVLETMTPLEFGSFRARLDSASGFQSVQFRELEAAARHRRRRCGGALSRRVTGAGAADDPAARRRRCGWRSATTSPAVASTSRPAA